MKIRNIIICLCFSFLMTAVSSCQQVVENVLTPSSTKLNSPAYTNSPTITPVDTNTPIPSPTSTSVPMLSVEDAHRRLLDLLASNGDCRLPCLWGITPGKTTYRQTQSILEPLSSISDLTGFISERGAISPDYNEDDLMLLTDVSFLSGNQIVTHIAFQVREMKKVIASNGEASIENVFDSEIFGTRIGYYSLPHVLSEQGIPASVMIASHGVPIPRGGSGGFDILLLYPNQGVLVNYTTQGYLVGSTTRGCPANAHVEMELYPSGQSDPFFELLKKTDWAVKMDYYKSLEEATSMSAEEFYETFRQSTDKCIETPTSLWTTPEQ